MAFNLLLDWVCWKKRVNGLIDQLLADDCRSECWIEGPLKILLYEGEANHGSQFSEVEARLAEWGSWLRLSSKSGGIVIDVAVSRMTPLIKSAIRLSLKKDTSRSTAVKNAAAAVKERSEELNVEAVMKELKSLEIADVINHEKKNKKKNKDMERDSFF
ncbi:hypothetical protein Tco_0073630 [Tanacetum coccineum]